MKNYIFLHNEVFATAGGLEKKSGLISELVGVTLHLMEYLNLLIRLKSFITARKEYFKKLLLYTKTGSPFGRLPASFTSAKPLSGRR